MFLCCVESEVVLIVNETVILQILIARVHKERRVSNPISRKKMEI